MQKEWFTQWFDSSYYHLLYKNRDEEEAQAFIAKLLGHLNLKTGAKVLDLGCGKGRHARFLAENGLDAIGVDIAGNSIEAAKKYEQERLAFFQHDMREPFREGYFDVVFSFFTSFGYFTTEDEHLQTLKNVRKNLRPNGLFVMDFFNAELVRRNLVASEEKTVGGVHFRIKRYIRHKTVFKRIEFTDRDGRRFWFRERVRLFSKGELEQLFKQADLEILQVFGDYQLNAFDPKVSSRLILEATTSNN